MTSVWIKRGEIAGRLGGSLFDHDSALAGQRNRIDQVDLLFESRFHQAGGEAGRDQLGVLVRDLAAKVILAFLSVPRSIWECSIPSRQARFK